MNKFSLRFKSDYENERQYLEETPDVRDRFKDEVAKWEKDHGPLRMKPQLDPSQIIHEPVPDLLEGIAAPPPVKPEPVSSREGTPEAGFEFVVDSDRGGHSCSSETGA